METNGTTPLSESAKGMIELFVQEMLRGSKSSSGELSAPSNATMNLQDYRSVCHELLGKNKLLAEDLLQAWLLQLAGNNNLKKHFLERHRYCLAIIPFTIYGNSLNQREIEEGKYLKIFVIDNEGKTVAGFSPDPSFVANLLPPELLQNAFEVHYENKEVFLVTNRDREKIMQQFQIAFRTLQALFGEAERA